MKWFAYVFDVELVYRVNMTPRFSESSYLKVQCLLCGISLFFLLLSSMSPFFDFVVFFDKQW